MIKFVLDTDEHQSFLQVVTSCWLCGARHAQSTQNKFADLCRYLQESVGDKVNFLPADKPERFPQVDSITLGVSLHTQACPKYPK